MVDDSDSTATLALRGQVIDLQPVRGHHPHQKWLVTIRVNAVETGRFAGQTFSFHVHSPTKARIEMGGWYRIRAVEVRAGEYLVNHIEPWKEARG